MGDEEVVVILCHFLVCLNFILIGMLREEIRGVLNTLCVCVLLRNHILEVVYSTIQYLQVVSTSHCQRSTELDGNL